MQNTVNDALQIALPGGIFGINSDIIARNNYSKKLDEVTITTADTTTTVTINGTAFTWTEIAGSQTKAAIAELVAALVNAGSEPVTAYYVATEEKFTVESNTPGVTTTVVGTANCTVVAQIGNAATIDFGLFVTQDQKDDEKARVPIVATDITNVALARGITVHTQAIEQFYQSAGGSGYALNAEMSIMKRGSIWVLPETAMVVTDSVYARYTVSGATKLGGIRNDADTSKAAIIPSARVVRGCALGGYCLIDINLP